jgi:myosin heavy subunit
MKSVLKISVFLIAAFVMVSCNQKQLEQQQDEIALLNHENETLRQEAIEKEENLNEFFESMAQIRDNLNEIKVRQNLITEETRDKEQLGQDVRKQIDEDLAMISKLMDDNRQRLASINRQLRDSNIKIDEFEKLVASLTVEIEERNVEISMLRDNMNELNIHNEALAETINKLEEETQEQWNVIEQKTEQINTAYFVYGTRRELQDNEIIDRQGGVLGIGRTSVVNSNVKTDYFTRVDITQVESVEVPGKKLRLVSVHPEDSYLVETSDEQASQIIIEDPEKFWSNTRYLVVSID